MKTFGYSYLEQKRIIIIFVLIASIIFSIHYATAQDYQNPEDSVVIIDPQNKQNISGRIRIAYVWGERLIPPVNLPRGIINLMEAMNRYTKIQTSLEKHLLLSSPRLLEMPFVFVSTADIIELTETEKNNITQYFRNGGFMFLDNAQPDPDFSKSGASLKQLLRDTIPNARFVPIPNNHPLYNSFFTFTDGPPYGAEVRTFGRGSIMGKQVLYLEGVWFKGRLVAVYSDKGYIIRWNEGRNNEPQLRIGVNIVVFALTQEGGIATKY